LGRPASDPDAPRTRADAVKILAALLKAWEDGKGEDSRWLRDDVARWATLIIIGINSNRGWTEEDAKEGGLLKGFQQRLSDKDNKVGRGYLPAIERVISPFEITPPPWVRTLLAFTGINVVAILLFVLSPGRRDFEKWLPFIVYAAGGGVSWIADLITNKLDL